jgi:hypothetical protein
VETEIVYLGRSNTVDLLLQAEDDSGVMQPVDLSTATRMTLTFGNILVSSYNADGEAITWDKSGYDVGEMRIGISVLQIIEGYYEAPLIVYDPTKPLGLDWGALPAQVWQDREGEVPIGTLTFQGVDDDPVPVNGSEIFTPGENSAAGIDSLIYQTRDSRKVIRFNETSGWLFRGITGDLTSRYLGSRTSKFSMRTLAYMDKPNGIGPDIYSVGWAGSFRARFDEADTQFLCLTFAPEYHYTPVTGGAAITPGWWYTKIYVEPAFEGTVTTWLKWWELGNDEPASPMLECTDFTADSFVGPYGMEFRWGHNAGGACDLAEIYWELT